MPIFKSANLTAFGIDWLKCRRSRTIEGTIKNDVTIRRQSGHYWLSIQTEREVDTLLHPLMTDVALDLGITRFATLSDGSPIEPKNTFKQLSQQLAIAQRKLARKVKCSVNWHKQKA